MKSFFTLLGSGLLAGFLQAGDAVIDHDPFPPFRELPQTVLMPRNAKISFDRHGNILVNGRIRYLLGMSYSFTNMDVNIVPTEGYPPELSWLYEKPWGYETAQRLGFDTLQGHPSCTWLRKVNPEFPVEGLNGKNDELLKEMVKNGLPYNMDNTAFPWSQGAVAGKKHLAPAIPPDAYNSFNNSSNNHWMPYNVFHPEGRKLYKMMFENSVDEARRVGIRHIVTHELFNEPAYNDLGEYNKKLFASTLKEEFGTVERMNKVFRHYFKSFEDAASLREKGKCPPLAVAWGKFMEKGFTEISRLGFETIRAMEPEAKVSTQVIGMNFYRVLPQSNINIYEVNRILNAVVLPTSGGLFLRTGVENAPAGTLESPSLPYSMAEGFLARHLFRAMADGKVLLNSEAYAGSSRRENANIVWMDLLRGSSATYMFSWVKIMSLWKPDFVAAGGKRLAERCGYILSNPYAHHPENLLGFLDAKKEIFRFADFFVPRERFASVPREVAVMLSYPTERYGVPAGFTKKNEIINYTAALELSHYAIDGIFEEQLSEGRADRYRVIVAPSVLCTYPGTVDRLADFVEKGGILIAARSDMPFDEYGNPLDRSRLFKGLKISGEPNASSGTLVFDKLKQPLSLPGSVAALSDINVKADSRVWEVLASTGGKAAVLKRTAGKGAVYFIAPMMQDYGIACVLSSILEETGISPVIALSRAKEGDLAGNIEAHVSRKDGIELAFLLNLDSFPKLVEVSLPSGAECAAELFSGKQLPVENGKALFMIGENSRIMLGFGKRRSIEERFGTLKETKRSGIKAEYAGACRKKQLEIRERKAKEFVYQADSANLVPLDLRPFANRSFTDAKPGDGEGGWTDQGAETCLDGVPWGIRKLAGIPCDLIRYDENDNRSCIMLRSKMTKFQVPEEVKDIPVRMKASKIYFFHTSAWSYPKNGKVMTYRLHFSDSTHFDIPVRNEKEIYDWWAVKRPEDPGCQVAWKNIAGRGFCVMEFTNPFPEKEIVSLDIISAMSDTIPIVIGITVEKFTSVKNIYRFESSTAESWRGVTVEADGENVFKVFVGEKTLLWSGARVSGKELKLSSEQIEKAELCFTLKGGTNRFGIKSPGMAADVVVRLFSGKMEQSEEFRLKRSNADQHVRIPLKELITSRKKLQNIKTLSFQYVSQPEYGFEVRDIRIEYHGNNDASSR